MKPPPERLAVFVPSLVEGGAERAAMKLAGELARRGHAVDLVLAAAEGPLLAEVSPAVRIVDLDSRRVLASLPGLARYLRRERPSTLVSFLDHANVVALWARRAFSPHTVVVAVEQNTLTEAAANGSTRRARAMPWLVNRFYPWANYVVAVSKGVADDLRLAIRLDEERLRVIFNPIITDDIAASAAEAPEHPWFSDSTPVLVAAGRLRPQKDFGLLLRAVATVRTKRPVRLIVLGEGSERHLLETTACELGIAADVDFVGHAPNPYAYMARAAAFVLSSRWEGLPTVLVEALRCEVPVIATDCPSGPREILADGKYGRLVPVGDVTALSTAIADALDGHVAPPPQESWRPYMLGAVVDQYLELVPADR